MSVQAACLIIRPAADDDVEALSALFVELDAHHIRRRPEEFRKLDRPARGDDRIWEMIRGRRGALLVAEDTAGRVVVGLAHVFERQMPETLVAPGRRVAELDSLVVAPERRRQGIAGRLVEGVDAWARAQGIGAVELNVRGYNTEALGFYQALGFETASLRLVRPTG